MLEPDKKYLNISEVSERTDVPTYTLRYWEKEFKQLRPERYSGQRKYSPLDCLNFIFFFGSISIVSPVLGFLPFLACVTNKLKLPNPVITTFSPFIIALNISSNNLFTTIVASFFEGIN